MTAKQIKRTIILPLLTTVTLIAASCQQTPDGPAVTLTYTGPNYPTWKVIYAAWIEDENGNNLQNLYLCKHVISQDLTGTVLPYWTTVKKPQHPDIDGVSGPSTQKNKTVKRALNIGSITKFRLCFEIDRSLNKNAWFTDRPSFIYKSALVDLNNLQPSYDLTLNGWMSNDTTGQFGQNPVTAIPNWTPYQYMTELGYIAEQGTSDNWSDMVTGLTAAITVK